MSDNVVALPGHAVPTPHGEPVPSVVEHLETLLLQAKRGELVGIASAGLIYDGTASLMATTGFQHRPGASYDLVAVTALLSRRLLNHAFPQQDKT